MCAGGCGTVSLVRRLLPFLALAVASAAVATPAVADTRTAKDPRRDTKGSHYPGKPYVWSAAHGCWVTEEVQECGENDYFENAGPLLDLASLSHGHRGAQLVHRVAMARNWKNALLSPGRGGQISLYFDVNQNAAFERRLDVFLRKGKLAAAMRAGSRTVATPVVTRPNAKTIEIRLTRASLGGPRTYKWFAFAGVACKREHDRCGDRSPNGGLLAHRLR
jgi:hypothetical protein